MIFSLFIPGKPPASGNISRVIVKRGTRGPKPSFVPLRKGAEWSDVVRERAKVATWQWPGWAPFDAAVGVRVIVARRWPMPGRMPTISRPVTRPDLENHLKRLLDALNGIVYRDDEAIVWLLVERVWHPTRDGVLVGVAPWALGLAAKELLDMDMDSALLSAK